MSWWTTEPQLQLWWEGVRVGTQHCCSIAITTYTDLP